MGGRAWLGRWSWSLSLSWKASNRRLLQIHGDEQIRRRPRLYEVEDDGFGEDSELGYRSAQSALTGHSFMSTAP